MKLSTLIITLFIFISKVSFSQNDYSDPKPLPTVNSTNVYAYIDGKRLDSIDAAYATFWQAGGGKVKFDYGQPAPNQKLYFLTDDKGQSLIFTFNSFAFLVNFFHFNHWEYYNETAEPGNINWILKKQ